MIKLALITVNYNGADKTIHLLESLRRQTDLDFTVIVVDNASDQPDRDRLLQYVLNAGSWTYLLQNSSNLGFSGGNNTGIEYALNPPTGGGAHWILLINNDTWVDPDFIARLKAKISPPDGTIVQTGLLAIPIHEGEKIAYCGRVRWLEATLLHAYDRTCHMMLERQKDGYVIGAGLLASASALRKIGLLDDRYFLYFEDADFSVRAHAANIPIAALDDIAIHHEVSSTTQSLGISLLLRYHWRNAHLFNWKNGPLRIKIALPFWSIFNIFKQLSKLVIKRNPVESRAILAGIFDFYFHRFGRISP